MWLGRFEGVAYLNHARGKVQLVTVIVLSDVVFFLQESNQKFHFVTQDNKVHAPFFLSHSFSFAFFCCLVRMGRTWRRNRPVMG